ncbi:MAG: efflux RND transporter periplasmic adaptor subunit [Candidatus Dadabacteria bacterium]|nr:efflux RND transporter periplasmic adaptor subunit [Candidatus Dadabacteria bacterium]
MKIAISIVIALLLFGCQDEVESGKAYVERPAVTDVTVIEVNPSQVDSYYETSGTVKAKTISTITSRVMGTVTSINFIEGDRVSKDDVLLTIDDRDVAQRVKVAEEGYNEAVKALQTAEQNKSLLDITHKRYKNLYDEKAISEQEMDEIETKKKVASIEYERAQAMVKRAEASLLETRINHGFTKITAPITGIVTEKKIDVGSMAMPGMPLFRVDDDSSFRVEVNVDERLLERLKIGMPVFVSMDATGRQVIGQITEIVPAVDPMSRTFIVKIDIEGESLKTGLYVRVLIAESKKETILVPILAIVEKGQLTGVYAVDDQGIITYRLIKTGKKYDEKIEVLSGINDGDRIIVNGIERAVDGGIIKQ